MSVKRYGFPMCECDATDEAWLSDFGMAELKDGGFVRWQDYAALLARYEKAVELGSNLRVDLWVFHNEKFNRNGESYPRNRPTIKAWMEAFEPEKTDIL